MKKRLLNKEFWHLYSPDGKFMATFTGDDASYKVEYFRFSYKKGQWKSVATKVSDADVEELRQDFYKWIDLPTNKY